MRQNCLEFVLVQAHYDQHVERGMSRSKLQSKEKITERLIANFRDELNLRTTKNYYQKSSRQCFRVLLGRESPSLTSERSLGNLTFSLDNLYFCATLTRYFVRIQAIKSNAMLVDHIYKAINLSA